MKLCVSRKTVNFVVLFAVVLLAAIAANAQCPAVMPAGTLCISQATGNQAAEDHRVRAALEAEVDGLKVQLLEKDKTLADRKATGLQNEADLKDRMHSTEVKYAEASGELIATHAELVRANARIDQLVQMVRPKKIGIINF